MTFVWQPSGYCSFKMSTTHFSGTGAVCPKGSKVIVTSRKMNESGFALFRSIVVAESAFPKVKVLSFCRRIALQDSMKNNLFISCWSTWRYRLLYPWMICLPKTNSALNFIKIFWHLVSLDQSTEVKSCYSIWLQSRRLQQSVLLFEPVCTAKKSFLNLILRKCCGSYLKLERAFELRYCHFLAGIFETALRKQNLHSKLKVWKKL